MAARYLFKSLTWEYITGELAHVLIFTDEAIDIYTQ